MVICNHYRRNSLFNDFSLLYFLNPYFYGMKVSRTFIIGLLFFNLYFSNFQSLAQCSMCTANAENSVQNGNTEGKGLNDGILYLLAMPYLLVAVVGYIWYKKYRQRNKY